MTKQALSQIFKKMGKKKSLHFFLDFQVAALLVHLKGLTD